MNSLVYLVLVSAKNSLKELLHKPGKLILYLLLAAIIIGLILLTLFTSEISTERLPLFWLQGIYFAFVVLFLVITIQKGLTSGDVIFDMSDVNLLFVSPVNPRAILLYGIIRLAKVSFWAGFFILFQSSSLSNFGVDFGGLLVLFFLFILSMVVQSILSLVIYSVTNGNPKRKLWVKVITVLVFVPMVAFFAVQFLQTQDPMAALAQTITSPFLCAVPIAGWTAASAIALLGGHYLAGALWLGLLVLGGGVMVAYIMLSKVDYYEDVLVATETAFEKKRAAQEGDVNAASASPAKVRVTKTGVGGFGASALFYKHLRETFRQNRFGFFGIYTLITFVCILAASLFMRGFIDVVVILQVLMWMQIFMIGNGRGLKELYVHYIYLIPESPFKKVLWSNLELVFKTLIESVLFLGIPGIILGGNFLVALASMATYTLFSLLLLGINYLSMRWTGANISQGILLFFYFLAVVLLMLPGLVPALVVGFSVGGVVGTLLALAILSGWELLAALLCFALSKDVLHNCDMPSTKPTGK
ncbi:putative ABC exporter domain-containing protein [Ruminococcaceae bacterium OttesenSCG-928-I18]|nr:putative ABC exporter domain-containing protein [Ruminococcaceae bacterium OttesenSCG-928-I18]